MPKTELEVNWPTASRRLAIKRCVPAREPVQEYCETLLSRVLWSEDATALRLRVLGVTSCRRGEGVSTVASQLAVAAATSGRLSVLLIDANLARPMVHRTFRVSQSPGWSDVLGDSRKTRAAIRPSRIQRLSVLPAGMDNRRGWPYDGTASPTSSNAQGGLQS